MKVTVSEYEGCFGIEMQAETMEDAAFLMRLGMNRTSELRSAESYVGKSGSFDGCVVIGKRKQVTSTVPRCR